MSKQDHNFRKAAILIAALDRDNADALLEQLAPEQAQQVRETFMQLGEIDPEEQQQVIEEFFQIGPFGQTASETDFDEASSGVEWGGSLAARFAATAPQPSEATLDSSPSGSVFDSLDRADSVALTNFLRQERPQTIAVVLSHLSRQHAARLLTQLESGLQVEVMRRLADLDQLDPETLQVIEQSLYHWLTEHIEHDQRRQTGKDKVAGILAAADQSSKQILLTNLQRADQQLASQLGSEYGAPLPQNVDPLTFDELAELGATSLALVIRETELEVLVLALAGAQAHTAERILRVFPAAEAASVQQRISKLGPTRLSDVELAQRELVLAAQRLIAQGEIVPKRSRWSMAA